jgi:uncharacterized protein
VLRAAWLLLLQTGIQIPAPTGLVNDFAHVLAPDAIARMEQIAKDVRTKSPGEIAVVTMTDIGTRDPQEVSLQIGRQWKVGKAGQPGDPNRNAGAVILLIPKETSKDGRGHCFVSTGSGAEGILNDAKVADYCREGTPAFRAGDYSTGLELVTLRTAQEFARAYNFSLDTALTAPPAVSTQPAIQYPTGGGGGISPAALFIIFIVIVVILSNMRRRGRGGCGCGPGCIPFPIIIPSGGFGRGGWGGGGGGWGGGGFGGGGGGFGGFGGGGGFSGGGGGSSW